MSLLKETTRRNFFKAGFATIAATTVNVKQTHAAIRPKASGETKVVYLGGDQLHNGMGQMQSLRGIFSKANWRFMATSDARYVTPEFISDADLLIITRWGGAIEGRCPEPIQEGAEPSDEYMTSELEDAIVDNVINRGMGFMALHCTCWTPEMQKFNDM
ncbi:MAG: hypothetical protein HOC71_07215, partial [Candidatus Latescibacteria bacterium]|nr:hypothetical protein [Candidatus Latescibacterota bacterium]